MWGFADFIYGGTWKNKVNAMNPNTLEELEESIKRETDCISEILLIRENAQFLKRCQKCVD